MPKHYFDGPPCPKGHGRKRYISNTQCVECAAENQRRYRKNHPKRVRAAYLKRSRANPERACRNSRNCYAGSHKKYRDAARERQRVKDNLPAPTRPCPDTCENCNRLPTSQRLHLDHCHDTGKFRGWLCGMCNSGLGLIGDNESAVLHLLEYLRRAS